MEVSRAVAFGQEAPRWMKTMGVVRREYRVTRAVSGPRHLLALVVESHAVEGAARRRLLFVTNQDGKETWSGSCASPSVAWADNPIRLVYAVREERRIRAVATTLQAGSGMLRSQPVEGVSAGAMGARRQSVAFVVRRADGAHALCIWRLGSNALMVRHIEGFRPSMDLPPVISGSGRTVALVNHDQSCFVCLDTVSGRWATFGAKPDLDPPWLRGWGGEAAKFFVDDKALAVWAAVRQPPEGATPRDHGFEVIFPSHRLMPLGSDGIDQEPPSTTVWGDYLEAISADTALRHWAVIYKTNLGRDCVAFGFPPREISVGSEKVLVGDKSLDSPVLSVTLDGERVVLTRKAQAGQVIVVISTDNGRVIHSWPLTRLGVSAGAKVEASRRGREPGQPGGPGRWGEHLLV